MMHAYAALCTVLVLAGMGRASGMRDPGDTHATTQGLQLARVEEPSPLPPEESGASGKAGEPPAQAERPAAKSEEPAKKVELVCGEKALGPGRQIAAGGAGGPQFGLIQFKQTLPLGEKEVIFTFDDGPHPQRTPEVLDILDRYCVKAVFFMIGEMAMRSPELVREIDRRGHIVANHTWSHPLSLNFLPLPRAEEQIDQGIAAVASALGRPPSPFFRFPGLGQSKALLEAVAKRNMAVWSVDAISGDSEGVSAAGMPRRLMSRLDRHGRGILLFHDIKKSTVDALPVIMEELREKGYRAVQVTVEGPVLNVPALTANLNPPSRSRGSAYARYARPRVRYR